MYPTPHYYRPLVAAEQRAYDVAANEVTGKWQIQVHLPVAMATSALTGPTSSILPRIIPPEHPFRTLVLCFDGTGDQFDSDNSNIVQFFSMLPKGDRTRQMVYYQAGIGTYTSPEVASPFRAKLNKLIDTAIAWSLDSHVMDGYEFLMQNYTTGDRICIFGFSRGAYTARSLAGMLHKVGLLPADNHRQIPFAYKMYTTTDEMGWKQSNAFKKAFSIDVDIEFIGVWDTVNSVGLIPRRLPFTTSNTIVRTFRHAISLDERRAKFKPNLWNRPNEAEQMLGVGQPIEGSAVAHNHGHDHDHDHEHEHAPEDIELDDHEKKRRAQMRMERKYSRGGIQPTDIEEVWFAGCHCDVGGGSVDNDTPSNLARIPLRWMIRECFKTNSGIMFESAGLRSIGIDPDSLYPVVKPRPPALLIGDARIRPMPPSVKPANTMATDDDNSSAANLNDSDPGPVLVASEQTEEEHDLVDALAPMYDQLGLAKFWWVLELWPLRQRYQRGDNTWTSYVGVNLGRGRFIPKQKANGVKVHRSVKTRLDAAKAHAEEVHGKGKKGKGKGLLERSKVYHPKAAFDLEHTIWVD
ncbi:hypothetical protein C8F01DRAFT_1368863 [Mycena amicta]|nr:hypothetical protein C8F01DRAFT_1368863 [Mycena amicta]